LLTDKQTDRQTNNDYITSAKEVMYSLFVCNKLNTTSVHTPSFLGREHAGIMKKAWVKRAATWATMLPVFSVKKTGVYTVQYDEVV